MKKTSFSVLALMLLAGACLSVNAQTRIGVIAGLSVPNLSGGSNEITQGYVSRLAPHYGITLEHDLGDRFSIQPEIIIDGQGGKRNGLQPITSTSLPALPSGGYYYAEFNNSSILGYIEVPILLRYNLGVSRIRVNVDAGPYFGYLLSATQKTAGTSTIYVDKNGTPLTIPIPPDYTQTVQAPPQSFDASTDVKDSIRRLNAGIEGGVGVVVALSDVHSVSLEVHGLYGLTNIQKYAEDGTNHTGNLLITLGYSYAVPGLW